MNKERKGCMEIYNHFGQEKQIEKLREEVEEFITAIQEGGAAEVAEECADVLLVMNQFVEVKRIHMPLVASFIQSKIKRTLARIKNGYYEEDAQ